MKAHLEVVEKVCHRVVYEVELINVLLKDLAILQLFCSL